MKSIWEKFIYPFRWHLLILAIPTTAGIWGNVVALHAVDVITRMQAAQIDGCSLLIESTKKDKSDGNL